MKLSIGRKMIGGVVVMAALTALAGLLGIHYIGVVGDSADVILNQKVPVADMSMEGKFDVCLADGDVTEYLLSDDPTTLAELESDYQEKNRAFDHHVDALIKGDPTQGVRAVTADSELARQASQVQVIHEDLQKQVSELMEHHKNRTRGEAEAKKLLTTFDLQARQLSDSLLAYENSLTHGKIDPRVDASMEAKALMFKFQAMVEQYMALETASRQDLRQRAQAVVSDYNAIKGNLDPAVAAEYDRLLDLAVGPGKLFDLKDAAVADLEEADQHHREVDALGDRIGVMMASIEDLADQDMKHAMTMADQAETNSRSTLILVTLGSLIVGLVIGMTITRSIVAPIRHCVDFAKQVASGDLTRKLVINTRDETRELADSLNLMIDSLKSMIGQIVSASGSVASAADEISAATDQITRGAQTQASASEETSSSMEQMAVSIQNVASNAESMASNVSETSSSIEQIAATIDKNSRNIADANDLAIKARDEAQQGGDMVLRTVDGMKAISGSMNQVSDAIRNLGERSAAIGGILEVIEEIADQTNLLALNAAIEAARAGDAGRGFAVVADEVRKLAERSIQSTQEIAQVIKQVQAETAAAVKVTQEAAAEAKGSSELADRAGDGIAKILQLVENTSLLMQDIASATREQSSGVTQVVKAAENMTEMTESVRNATFEQKKGGDNVVQAVENINEISRANLASVEQLARSAKDMSREADGLQGLIARFKVA